MFIVDKPYVSEFFKETVRDNAIPVVDTDIAKELGLYSGTQLISEDRAIEVARKTDNLAIYTTSENSIGWISKHLPFKDLPDKIGLFKDKLKFRNLTKPLFPNFYFKEVCAEDLDGVPFDTIPLPFVIKPRVGFFSMGVYKVSNHEQWLETIDLIRTEVAQVKDIYPEEVLNPASFIIEESINGEEFAVDAYYDFSGEPVVLNIHQHPFSSDGDVSDRVYVSSKKIIETNLDEFTNFIVRIGALAGVNNFPVHMELRRDKDGALLPIEVNPMRFGGWCTTADAAFMAYGFNPYLYYFS